MTVRGALKVATRSVLAAIVVAAAATPILAAFVDRAPNGEPRFTIFHLALTLSDDHARHAIRNSILVALSVTLLAALLGTMLGRMASTGRFMGHRALLALARAPAAYTPLISAVGLLALEPWIPTNWRVSWRWLAFTWVELTWAAPRIALVVANSVSIVDRTWVDTAKLAGGRSSNAFWSLGWPLARNGVVRTTGEVFFLTLFEPGAPLVLGLRNTLSVKLVESATGFGGEPRAASFVVIGLMIGLAMWGLLRGPAGPKHNLPGIQGDWIRRRASRVSAMFAAIIFAVWGLFSFAPIIGIARLSLGAGQSGRSGFAARIAPFQDAEVTTTLGHSLFLGIGATIFAVVFAWSLGPLSSRPSWRHPTSWTRVIPPLAIGLGILLIPSQLEMIFGRFGALGNGLAVFLGDFADPYRYSWFVLMVGTALFTIPALQIKFEQARLIDVSDAHDVARTLGASRWIARLTCSPQYSRVISSAIAHSIATSAIASAPALILARTEAVVPFAVSIVNDVADPTRAATLALLALLFPLASWITNSVGNAKLPRFRLARS